MISGGGGGGGGGTQIYFIHIYRRLGQVFFAIKFFNLVFLWILMGGGSPLNWAIFGIILRFICRREIFWRHMYA